MAISSILSVADPIFSALAGQQDQMTAYSQSAMATGAALYTNGNYDDAARSFKMAIGLDPSSDNAAKAYDLLATVYMKQKKPQDAIKAYQSSIRISPADDNAHLKLGNIYFGLDRYSDAEKEYKTAVKLNPTSSTNIYSLGQAYMATGRYQEAEDQFKKVIKMDPSQYGGYYGLGQTYSKEGRSEDAIAQFQKVISLKKAFYDVYVDLGSAYADLGQMDEVQKQVNILNTNAPSLAVLLGDYVNKVSKPQFLLVSSTNGFADSLGPNTLVSALSDSLATPGASKKFEMAFIFSKEMDASTVQNISNWSISKTTDNPPSGAYNWGLPNSPTDVKISSVPFNIIYLPDSLTATISVLVTQNAGGDGTIDPSHIMFRFWGKDAYGNAMDPKADEYNGFSLIV